MSVRGIILLGQALAIEQAARTLSQPELPELIDFCARLHGDIDDWRRDFWDRLLREKPVDLDTERAELLTVCQRAESACQLVRHQISPSAPAPENLSALNQTLDELIEFLAQLQERWSELQGERLIRARELYAQSAVLEQALEESALQEQHLR